MATAASNSPYDRDFYENQRQGSLRSAGEIVPFVVDLVQPASVVDLGCGVGTWLSVFKGSGVGEIAGFDGDYVDKRMLQIEPDEFQDHDFRDELILDRKFDLSMSLEVAEHLPGDRAESFVKTLTSLAPVVMFSAAIPGQGGTEHLNEQWQAYWVDLFAAQGYRAIDCIRPRFWDNPAVSIWYRQNTLLYVDADYLAGNERLQAEYERCRDYPASIAHPDSYLEKLPYSDASTMPLKTLLSMLLPVLGNAIRRKF